MSSPGGLDCWEILAIVGLIAAAGVVAGLFLMNNEGSGPVDDYDIRLIETDGLHTEFVLIFEADRPGKVSASLNGVDILINGRESVSFAKGHNELTCTVGSVGQSGIPLLNNLDFHFS